MEQFSCHKCSVRVVHLFNPALNLITRFCNCRFICDQKATRMYLFRMTEIEKYSKLSNKCQVHLVQQLRSLTAWHTAIASSPNVAAQVSSAPSASCKLCSTPSPRHGTSGTELLKRIKNKRESIFILATNHKYNLLPSGKLARNSFK